MSESIFITNQNPISGRWSIFEDNGISAWMYLTNSNEEAPIGDCWIYNRITAPSPSDIKGFKNGPPPASNEYAKSDALVTSPKEKLISLIWSKDGNAVSMRYDGITLGYITFGEKRGYSRLLLKSGPWGNEFDEIKYQLVFNKL